MSRASVAHLSLVVGGELVDAAGGRLGRVDDLIVRLGGDGYPPLAGLLATVAGRQVFVAAEQVAELGASRVLLASTRVDLRPFARRQGEVLLRGDVLDRQLVDVDGRRLVRANDIELARVAGWWAVVGVDVGVRGFARRLLPRRLAARLGPGPFLDWASVEPLTGHLPSLRLRVPHPKLARLHPAELADLVEAASLRNGAEIVDAVRGDRELEADVFEELDDRHRLGLLAGRTDAEAAAVLARMEDDDAADLLGSLEEERREAVIALLPTVQRRRVRTLLGYDPATAGGLMGLDLVAVYPQATRDEALDRVRRSSAGAEALAAVFVVNERHRLRGAIALADLLRADPGSRVGECADPAPRSVSTAASLEEIARLMADFDLAVVPVLDASERLIGVVTVDDILEAVIPRGWRRPVAAAGGDPR